MTFRKAHRVGTPIICGVSGPTKSGKSMSALRIATGLALGGVVAVINSEGKRGNQYADSFDYVALDLSPPFTVQKYRDAIGEAKKIRPAVLIVDSQTHMHDGPGGMLEWHDEILAKMAGNDQKKREKCNMAAWIEPKGMENKYVYDFLDLDCHIVLCFRAKEKVSMGAGKVEKLGYRPISSDRVLSETFFDVVLLPEKQGYADPELSVMRAPFGDMLRGKLLDENAGRELAEYAAGGAQPESKRRASEAEQDVAGQEAGLLLVDWQAAMEGAGDMVALGDSFIKGQRALKAAGATEAQLSKFTAKKDELKAAMATRKGD